MLSLSLVIWVKLIVQLPLSLSHKGQNPQIKPLFFYITNYIYISFNECERLPWTTLPKYSTKNAVESALIYIHSWMWSVWPVAACLDNISKFHWLIRRPSLRLLAYCNLLWFVNEYNIDWFKYYQTCELKYLLIFTHLENWHTKFQFYI